jgi:tyrosine-protein kinase Etk/Wzc
LERSDPREVTRIVNAIANVYQRQNVERRSAEAEQTLIFINEQLPRVQKDLEVAENAFNSYRLSQKSADLTKETELVLQQSVELEQQRLQLQQKREEALRKFTAKHPVMQALDGQLQQIEREQNSLLQRVKGLPETQQELLRLSRDVEVNNALYTALLSNAEQLRIAKAGTIGNVRIVDSALQPYKPSRPDLSLALPLSGVLGAFFGLILVFVRNALHRGIADPAIIERRFCLPVFATIPHSPAQRKIFRKKTGSPMDLRILAAIDPSSPAIEAIRSLRTALHVSTRSSTGNVMMVCGPSPSLGKSFVSANLSASLAMAGRSVALVDADLRRGQLHQSVGLDRKPGLTDALTERCEFADVVHATGIPNLSIVPTGPIPSNPAELLLNPGFDRMISWLSERFEHVVIDTAPVLIVSDAVIAGRCAATALLVLKSGQHSLREIDDSLKRLRAGGIGVNGIVLNEVGRNQLDRYGSETGYYNYNYKRVDSKKEQTA